MSEEEVKKYRGVYFKSRLVNLIGNAVVALFVLFLLMYNIKSGTIRAVIAAVFIIAMAVMFGLEYKKSMVGGEKLAELMKILKEKGHCREYCEKYREVWLSGKVSKTDRRTHTFVLAEEYGRIGDFDEEKRLIDSLGINVTTADDLTRYEYFNALIMWNVHKGSYQDAGQLYFSQAQFFQAFEEQYGRTTTYALQLFKLRMLGYGFFDRYEQAKAELSRQYNVNTGDKAQDNRNAMFAPESSVLLAFLAAVYSDEDGAKKADELRGYLLSQMEDDPDSAHVKEYLGRFEDAAKGSYH